MTMEEAIQDIKECIKPSVGGISLDMAIEALEKQIPKEVIDDENNICPTCGSFNSRIYNKYYCGKCGQKLIWS